jgi:RNA polymerase sigma-70 factor (ECF subfamily)
VATEPEKLNGVGDANARGPEEQAANQETGELLLAAMDHLPAQDRALLTLRYREGLSDAELAEATDMKVNTVKTRLHRARLALRQRLSRTMKESV